MWFDGAIWSTGFEWVRDTAQEWKDVLTLLVGLAAFITSVTVARINRASEKRKQLEDARKEFAAAVMGIAQTRDKLEELRGELGVEMDDIKYAGRRISLADQREFYLSKALSILDRHGVGVEPSSFENILLAAALIDSGRVAKSVPFYEKARDLASDELRRTTAQLVYGRALIVLGKYDQGRKEMLAAAERYIALGGSEYDLERCLENAAEAYRRLVLISLNRNQYTHLLADYETLRSAVGKITDPGRQKFFRGGLTEIENRMAKLHPPIAHAGDLRVTPHPQSPSAGDDPVQIVAPPPRPRTESPAR